MKEYEVRPYQPGDKEGIIELLQFVFDVWPPFDLNCTPLEHWEWKFIDNPLKIYSIIVSRNIGKIIGCLHCTSRIVKIGEKSIFCSQGVDLAVHPDFRSMGIYKKMSNCKDELLKEANVKLTYSVTGNPILMREALKIGWLRFPYPILGLILINDIDSHLKMMPNKYAWLKKGWYYILKTLNRIRNTLNQPSPSTAEFHIKKINSFDDRIELFWYGIMNHYSFIQERSNEYLNWRYCDYRGGDYVVKQVEECGFIIGYIVLRINRRRDDYPVGYIVDFLTLPHRLDVANALIKDAVLYFKDQKVNTVHAWIVKNHPYERVLKRYGFLDIRKRVHLSYNPLIEEGEFYKLKGALSHKLYFILGDTDAI